MKRTIAILSCLVLVLAFSTQAMAKKKVVSSEGCSFTEENTSLYLAGDCDTEETILIPDGFTLDGRGYTITAVDPFNGHFLGAVVTNQGTTAHVKNLIVTAFLNSFCDDGIDRLRGIMFVGASGSITFNTVTNLNQGSSGCQEGNAIEVRNTPLDGSSHPDTQTVEIAHNIIEDYQKTGIVANGDVDVMIHHNSVGDSATQEYLAANSIQLGFGATGSVKHNNIDGNQWMGPTAYTCNSGVDPRSRQCGR